MSTEDTNQAAYATLWDSDQRIRIMVAITTGCPFVVAAGAPLSRAELAHQGPNPEDWMLLEAGVDLTTLDDGLWVVEGWARYHTPKGEDPDVSASSWAVTYRRPSTTEVAWLAGARSDAVHVWGHSGSDQADADLDVGTGLGDCDGAPDALAEARGQWGAG